MQCCLAVAPSQPIQGMQRTRSIGCDMSYARRVHALSNTSPYACGNRPCAATLGQTRRKQIHRQSSNDRWLHSCIIHTGYHLRAKPNILSQVLPFQERDVPRHHLQVIWCGCVDDSIFLFPRNGLDNLLISRFHQPALFDTHCFRVTNVFCGTLIGRHDAGRR